MAAAAAIARSHQLRNNNNAVLPFEDEPASPTSPAGHHHHHREAQVADWPAARVARWLESIVRPKLAQAMLEHDIDGAMLIKMDGEAWKEIGVTSPLERARLLSAVEKKTAADVLPFSNATPARPIARQYAHGGKEGPRAEAGVRQHFIGGRTFSGLNPRTPEVGREHHLDWALAIANANKNPAEVKQHYLRFLGMYNIIDLLVFTINMSCEARASISTRRSDLFIHQPCLLLCCLQHAYASLANPEARECVPHGRYHCNGGLQGWTQLHRRRPSTIHPGHLSG